MAGRLVDNRAAHREGPIWDPTRNRLRWMEPESLNPTSVFQQHDARLEGTVNDVHEVVLLRS